MNKSNLSHRTGMSFEAVIFDRDGVLTDFDIQRATVFFETLLPISMAELIRRLERWAELVGYPKTVDEEQIFFRDLWNHLSDDLNLSHVVRTRLYGVDYTDYIFPYPDAYPALSYVKSRGCKIGVLSNFSLASLQLSLDRVGFGSLVDVAITASVSQVAKPAPQAYLGIASALGVQPNRCLFFDNEAQYVDGARAIGMTAYLVDRQVETSFVSPHTIADLSALDALISTGPLE